MNCKECIHYDVCDKFAEFELRDMMRGPNCSWCPQAKNESHLLELPCKIGDEVWCCVAQSRVRQGTVKTIEAIVNPNDITVYLMIEVEDENCKCSLLMIFGTTVFLTREEAEKHIL